MFYSGELRPTTGRAEGIARGADGDQHPVVGLWQFGTGLQGGAVLLTVTANMARDMVQRMGETILKQATSEG